MDTKQFSECEASCSDSKTDSSFGYIRENSVNENKEIQSPAGDVVQKDGGLFQHVDLSDVKIKTKKMEQFDRQNSLTPFVKKADTKITMCSNLKYDDRKLGEDNDQYILNRFRKLKKCVFCMSTCGFCMLTLSILLFVYLVMTVPNSGNFVDTTDDPRALFTRQHSKTSGNFILDQDLLRETSQVRWVHDVYSVIDVVPGTTCVKIPLNGDYFVNSRFTFKIPVEEKIALLTHNLRVLSKDEINVIFRRQYVDIPNDRSSEYRKSSVFTKIFHLQAGEKLCASVSIPKLLYASGIDNDLTMVRLNDDV